MPQSWGKQLLSPQKWEEGVTIRPPAPFLGREKLESLGCSLPNALPTPIDKGLHTGPLSTGMDKAFAGAGCGRFVDIFLFLA